MVILSVPQASKIYRIAGAYGGEWFTKAMSYLILCAVPLCMLLFLVIFCIHLLFKTSYSGRGLERESL